MADTHRLIIDTNIILDVLLKREKFFTSSYKVLKLIEEGKFKGYVSLHTLTDVYYIVQKYTGRGKDAIKNLIQIMNIAEADRNIVIKALSLDRIKDFEDALLVAIASSLGACLITRDEEILTAFDFASSPDNFLSEL